MVDAYDPDFDLIHGWAETTAKESTSQGIKLKHMLAVQRMQYDEGAYGADWSTVNLPSTSSGGKHCVRANSDDGNKSRLYSYNTLTNTWWYFEGTEV